MGSILTNWCNLLFNPRRHSANTNRVLCAGDLMGICLQSHLQHQCGFHKYGYAHRDHTMLKIKKQNTTDFSSVVFCRKSCLFGCYHFTANFSRPS
jgi:hypothetical protein